MSRNRCQTSKPIQCGWIWMFDVRDHRQMLKAHPTWVSFGCSMSGNATKCPKPTERGWIGGFWMFDVTGCCLASGWWCVKWGKPVQGQQFGHWTEGPPPPCFSNKEVVCVEEEGWAVLAVGKHSIIALWWSSQQRTKKKCWKTRGKTRWLLRLVELLKYCKDNVN